jgi:hypothetical protein
MFAIFILGCYLQLYKEKDEDKSMFHNRVEYILKKSKEISNNIDINQVPEILEKILKDSLMLKNKFLYNVDY